METWIQLSWSGSASTWCAHAGFVPSSTSSGAWGHVHAVLACRHIARCSQNSSSLLLKWVAQMAAAQGMQPRAVDQLLNKESGLLGLSGTSDLRSLLQARQQGDERASVAYEVRWRSAGHPD